MLAQPYDLSEGNFQVRVPSLRDGRASPPQCKYNCRFFSTRCRKHGEVIAFTDACNIHSYSVGLNNTIAFMLQVEIKEMTDIVSSDSLHPPPVLCGHLGICKIEMKYPFGLPLTPGHLRHHCVSSFQIPAEQSLARSQRGYKKYY